MYIGLKHAVFTPFNGEPAAGALPSYLPGVVVARLIGADEALEFNDASLDSDDATSEKDKSFKSGKYTLGVDDITPAVKKLWFGMQEATVGGAVGILDAAGYDSPYGGFGFYRKRKKAGVMTIEAHWYYKTKWVRPNINAKSKTGGAVEFQTPTVEGDIMVCDDTINRWHFEVEFNTEAEAEAWLDTMAGVVTPAALALSSSSPVDGNGSASKTAAITLTFNNVMSQARSKFFLMRCDTGAKVEITGVTWDATGKIASLAHAALQGSTLHSLAYLAVDVNSQALEDQIDFTTVA